MKFKHSIFFIILTVLVFGFFLPKICQGQTDKCLDGCGDVYYFTECGEKIKIGECVKGACCEIDPITGECIKDCPCNQCSCGGEWDEYKCKNEQCDGDILVRHCEVHCCGLCFCEDGITQCSTCAGCVVTCIPENGELCEDCGSWQKPFREPCECPKWGLQKPECKCKGECIDKPENPKYYQDLLYPLNECNAESEWQMESNNIDLPIKLDWDDVRGWEDSWKEGGDCKYVKDCSGGGEKCIEENAIKNCLIGCREIGYREN